MSIKQNGDLVIALHHALGEIALCQAKIRALEQCINHHNAQKTE